MKTNRPIFVSTIALILIIYVLTYSLTSRLISLKAQQIKNQAVDGCLSAGSLSFNDTKGTTKTEFKLDSYRACLLDKGYSTLWE